MASRAGSFIFGMVTAIVVVVVGVYLFVKGGGVSMETTAPMLPFEQTLAGMAIRASIGNAGAQKNPLPLNETNLLAGAQVFKENCAFCHTAPGGTQSAASKGMFPKPPQLFTPDQMVTDDPEGVTFWIVTHGIRLSAMPGFGATLSDTERWQVTMLVAHADKLPAPVQSALSH
jgi:thiosulfate dehydrogenase